MNDKLSPARHFKHAVGALKYSCRGLAGTFRSETAFQQESVALVLLPILAWLLGVRAGHIPLLVAAWLLVMLAELLNSALESICNLVSPEYHILVKRAKDAGSAAVLLALLINFCFWLYLFYTYW
jgi:diacylglycerol kinase (ATP)